MRKQYLSGMVTFRFRRWSRKGYAAFISIHRSVSIGQLACHLAERFYAKSTATQTGLTLRYPAGEADEEEKASLLPVVNSVSSLLLLILSTLLLPQVAEVASPAGQHIFVNKPDSGKYLFEKGTSRYLFI
ncbi:MAG: hypothetical protein LUD02_09040 [Tannerellaceae bacterium]|nr:hypothetical protein [Tannerellaceae bacterium]MCD8264272.1 hypothetical protein [Tannerellaceae bacterium]